MSLRQDLAPPIVWERFARGYTARTAADVRSQRDFERLQNAILDALSIEKRPGYALLGSALAGSGGVQSMYHTRGTATRAIIATANTKIFGINPDTGAAATLESGVSSGSRWDAAEYRQPGGTSVVVIASPSDHPRSWDGSAGATTVLVSPVEGVATVHCGVIMSHMQRIWVSHARIIHSTKLNKLPSAAGNWEPQLIPPDMGPSAGDGDIVKMVSIGQNRAAIFCERAVYIMTGSDIGSTSGAMNLRFVSISDIGCPAPRTVVRIGDEVYFLGVDAGYYGLYVLSGQSVECLSYAIEDDINDVNTATLTTACATRIGRHYLACLPISPATDTSKGFLFHREGSSAAGAFSSWVFADMPRSMTRDPVSGRTFWGTQSTGRIIRYLDDWTHETDAGVAIDLDAILGPARVAPIPVDLSVGREVEVHAGVYAGGSIAVSVGRDAEAVGSFKVLGSSPLLTESSGVFSGDRGGASVSWQGTARKNLHLPEDYYGQCLRIRLRETTTKRASIKRVALRGVPRAR